MDKTSYLSPDLRARRRCATAAALLAAAPALAQDKKAVTPAEMNYQALSLIHISEPTRPY